MSSNADDEDDERNSVMESSEGETKASISTEYCDKEEGNQPFCEGGRVDAVWGVERFLYQRGGQEERRQGVLTQLPTRPSEQTVFVKEDGGDSEEQFE